MIGEVRSNVKELFKPLGSDCISNIKKVEYILN